ncbi:MAG TPA: hypothetical protein VGV93_02835 [Acidimicrobiales bacterium]|nr:hypothetical protein [Acidimicrobiales bacterium]
MPIKLVAVAAIAIAGAACTSSDEGTQPRPDVTTFEQGDFNDIPLLPRSEALSPPNEEAGNVARSYAVRNTAPEDVLAFYEEQLAEFQVVEEPASIGANTFRGRWRVEGQRVLTVSATLANNLDVPELPDSEQVTQYSLSLAPAAE